MLRVEIYINNKKIVCKTAVNISEKLLLTYGQGLQIYETDCGRRVAQDYSDGAKALAIKLLEISLNKKKKVIKSKD